MYPQTYTSTGLGALIGFAIWTGTAVANCSRWEQDSVDFDTGYSFSNQYSQIVDMMVCPADSEDDCRFPIKSYDITAERDVTGQGIESLAELGLPDDEVDSIFKLVRDSFNKELASGNENPPEPIDFVTLNATVNTGWLEPHSTILTVEPAINKTLLWTSFYVYSRGTLSGCSNKTLNDMTLRVAAPYLTQDEKQGNQTVLAGTWAASYSNTTEDTPIANGTDATGGNDGTDETDGGTSLAIRSTVSASSGLVVIATCLAFLV